MLLEQVKTWTPSNEMQRAQVLQQLERLLQNPHFHKSKRFPVFLRFVVTEALAGRTENLKERTLGIEVFGKNSDYDTSEDPIVRVTAGEIRKRIAQYYQEPGHEQEIKLLLPSGSYVPQFHLPQTGTSTVLDEVPTYSNEAEPSSAKSVHRRNLRLGKLLWLAALALALGTAGIWRYLRPPAITEFWAPFLESPDPVLFCVADQSQYSSIVLRDASDPKRQTTLSDRMITVVIDDISPVVNIAGMLHARGRAYRVFGESVTTLTDLRQGPSVFIGAFDNGWTLRLTAPLRFHFANNPDMTYFWIEDQSNPGKRDWSLDRSHQQTGTYKDYAIVTRVLDPNTGRFAVVAAGIARGGTIAAGEFLVSESQIGDLARQLPRDWNGKNLEIVLETQVIDGRSGPPRIDAVTTW